MKGQIAKKKAGSPMKKVQSPTSKKGAKKVKTPRAKKRTGLTPAASKDGKSKGKSRRSSLSSLTGKTRLSRKSKKLKEKNKKLDDNRTSKLITTKSKNMDNKSEKSSIQKRKLINMISPKNYSNDLKILSIEKRDNASLFSDNKTNISLRAPSASVRSSRLSQASIIWDINSTNGRNILPSTDGSNSHSNLSLASRAFFHPSPSPSPSCSMSVSVSESETVHRVFRVERVRIKCQEYVSTVEFYYSNKTTLEWGILKDGDFKEYEFILEPDEFIREVRGHAKQLKNTIGNIAASLTWLTNSGKRYKHKGSKAKSSTDVPTSERFIFSTQGAPIYGLDYIRSGKYFILQGVLPDPPDFETYEIKDGQVPAPVGTPSSRATAKTKNEPHSPVQRKLSNVTEITKGTNKKKKISDMRPPPQTEKGENMTAAQRKRSLNYIPDVSNVQQLMKSDAQPVQNDIPYVPIVLKYETFAERNPTEEDLMYFF